MNGENKNETESENSHRTKKIERKLKKLCWKGEENLNSENSEKAASNGSMAAKMAESGCVIGVSKEKIWKRRKAKK